MSILTVLLIWAFGCGAITAAIAHQKGRSALGWFFLGFFLGFLGILGIVAIVVAAVVPNLREQEEQRNHTQREARRLREQLRQEKAKNEAFRQHAAARLDTHDGALGLDTRLGAEALPGPGRGGPAALAGPRDDYASGVIRTKPASGAAGPAVPAAAPAAGLGDRFGASASAAGAPAPAAPTAAASRRQWYYELRGERKGPVGETELLERFRSGELRPGTLVWCAEFTSWTPAEKVDSLKAGLRGSAGAAPPAARVAPAASPGRRLSAAEASVTTPPVRRWYYENFGQITGPVPEPELAERVKSRQISASTLVWHEDMDGWLPAGQVPALRALLGV